MTHTPGPWRVGDAGMTIFGPPNGKPSPQRIADMAPGDERKANAALIAAAPELLGWAKLLVAAIEHEIRRDHGVGDSEGANLKRATLNRVFATIAKAEGRAGR